MSKKRRAGVKGVKTLENFFTKEAAKCLPEPTGSILTVSNDDEYFLDVIAYIATLTNCSEKGE